MKINIGFIIFIGIFLSLYGSLHFYFYRKVTRAFNLTPAPNIILIIVLCLLLLSPIIIHLMEGNRPEALSAAVTYIGYFWIGIIFLLFALNLTVDIYRVIIYTSSRIFSPSLLKLMPDRRIILLVVIVLTMCINLYGLFEAWNIKTREITLKTDKLPEEIEKLRIVQISDIHFSQINGVGLANRITDTVISLKPDLLVSTGDLIDDGLRDPDKVEVLFRSIKTKYGKYAVTGNHEFFGDLKKNLKFTENCGFKMLRNKSTEVNNYINIAGVDDPAANSNSLVKAIDENIVMEGLSPDKLNIFLKHQPRIKKDSIGKFDIQLSGHTHDGQIFPFKYLVRIAYKYMSGIYYLGDKSYLYVSRGTGTWGPPVRFLSPPEITVIDFKKERTYRNKVRKKING
ncbi:MAG: metallophosphoesterase [Desulfobacteraceae bacterium]